VDIRPAGPADAAPIAALLNALLATTTVEWTDRPYDQEAVQRWLGDHHVVLVATDEGDEVIGVAAYGWFRDAGRRPGYRFTVESTVHVRRDHWRGGVGRALMERLLEQGRADGLHVVVAAVDSANTPSIELHRGLGFAEVARMPEVGAKFGRWLDLVLLQRRLDDRPAPDGP